MNGIDTRDSLLNIDVCCLLQVLQDMLQLLKESVLSRHSERLEQIVIALIGVEIGEFLSFASSFFR